ncbi:MAG: hypothetical protein ACI9VT_002630 [Psychroserpens sp.]
MSDDNFSHINKFEFPSINNDRVTPFIERWKNTKGPGAELADFQSFIIELCDLLGVPKPDPKSDSTNDNQYIFERPVDSFTIEGERKASKNRIDLYRRDCFVMEGKQTGLKIGSQGWNNAMQKAKNQADNYVRTLPAEEGRPPFIIVVDVGSCIQIYSEFSRSGGIYTPFPDPSHYLIKLNDLVKPAIQQRLQALWHAPESLDPSNYAAKVTKALSLKLAELAKSLEESGYEVVRIAHFLKRCLFTMFSEDVELIPESSFTNLLVQLKNTPEFFSNSMKSLWDTMNTGGFEGQIRAVVPRFNGSLFVDIDPIPLNAEQIQLLIEAAKADWRFVEPAIFGTLLERALDPKERHKLGAHYTPRAYVERLVMPTLIEPLRKEWEIVKVSVEILLQQGKENKAADTLRLFHMHLCEIKILDPACGSANFLYVALEHLKRLEGEVINYINDFSDGQAMFDIEGFTVDPHQFLGIEINPRAAAIAEIVLWIGFLQWHYRLNGKLDLVEPILRDFKNIENRDALIEYESREPLLDEAGNSMTIWDRVSYKNSPITGQPIPDDECREVVYRYIKPSRAIWPDADYIIGNPPFIGSSTMRRALGDGYVEALRNIFKGDVPESSDFVMYWWNIAAEMTRDKKHSTTNFGFITTNSIKQIFNRRVLDAHLNDDKDSLQIAFAIPDHPWVDNSDGAAVRIAMTSVCKFNSKSGRLLTLDTETSSSDGSLKCTFNEEIGKILSDLRIGANIYSATSLKSNQKIANTGVIPLGSGMVLTEEQAKIVGVGEVPELDLYIKQYRNGRDIAGVPRNVFAIDLYGLSISEVENKFPQLYQWLLERVKPDRDVSTDKGIRENWWLHRRSNEDMRNALKGLNQYIATVRTSKHRLFVMLSGEILPDQKLLSFGLSDMFLLGILSSRIHAHWAIATGGRQGVGNDPVYVKSTSFECFPFPTLSGEDKVNIQDLAERINKHRKYQQYKHPKLTLTNMYNVLEKLRLEEPLNDKEKEINQNGLVSVLRDLHDKLDRAVFSAYGWEDLGDIIVGMPGATIPCVDKREVQTQAEEDLLSRLVTLNHQRVSMEAQGHMNWLRSEFQSPDKHSTEIAFDTEVLTSAEFSTATVTKATWPKEMREQITTIISLLSTPIKAKDLAIHFKRSPVKAVNAVLDALDALGKVQKDGEFWSLT